MTTDAWRTQLSEAGLAAYLAALSPAPPALATERLDELALCCACAAGIPGALAVFEQHLFPEIDRALRHLDRDGDLTDEVKQVLRHKLFVSEPGARPGITSYTGRGPLGRWLHVVAIREALMLLRQTRRAQARTTLVEGDLELAPLDGSHRAAFAAAFADALTALTSQQRNLLYYHLVGRLSIDQIGAIYRVHRVTAFRWVRAARTALVERTRALLAARLALSVAELDSLIRVVQRYASVSVERLLREAGAPATGDSVGAVG